MIELIAARGNTSLDSAVALTKSIRLQIQSLGILLAKTTDEELERQNTSKRSNSAQAQKVLGHIVLSIKGLLSQIEDAVPLINLAITTSGVSLSTALPSTVSPSRLLQSSMFLATADSAYAADPDASMQVGPAYTLSVYMLFEGHVRKNTGIDGIRETTWQEVIHKARVKLVRVPMKILHQLPVSQVVADDIESSQASVRTSERHTPTNIPSESKAHEFSYQLLIVEDLDDGRVHTFEDEKTQPGPFEDVATAGIREIIPIHEISRIFYADTGKILNIGADGEPNNPVLLLKRDVGAVPPRRMVDADFNSDFEDEHSEFGATDGASKTEEEEPSAFIASSGPWRFPTGLDLSWIAFEVYAETDSQPQVDTDEESSDEEPTHPRIGSPPKLQTPLNTNRQGRNKRDTPKSDRQPLSHQETPATKFSVPSLRTSLSLLELLIRLSSLQQFQQCSHLAISDELLNFFLSESSSTGAGADVERRKHMRSEAARRVGFDPYAESPMKFRREGDWKNAQEMNEEGVDDEDELPLIHTFSSSSRCKPTRSRDSAGYSPLPGSRDSLISSPSVRAQNKSSDRNLRKNELRGSVGLSLGIAFRSEQTPLRNKESILRSESDSTLGTSPSDGQGRVIG
jgi:hypothetical protein